MPPLPKVDERLIHIFLSVILFRDFIPHTRRCLLGAKHRPKVDAGQDANNPQRLFIVHEEASCLGIDGCRCHHNGVQYLKQLTEPQRVAAVAEVVQLEPFPYNSEALLDWCVNYLVTRQHHLPGQFHPERAAPAPQPPIAASAPLPHPPLRVVAPATSHETRHRRWVSSLIPPLSNNPSGVSRRAPSRVIPCTRASASVSLSAPVTSLAKVYCYVRNGCLPQLVEVDANQQEVMTYVNLCHPDILKVFGLKPRARNLPERIQVYDEYGDKWYHPAAVSLWLRLCSNEALILKVSTITRTPGLQDYVLKTFSKPHRPSTDSLRGFLALSRTPADRRPPFSPVPPLTVMLADVPENPGAPTSHSSTSTAAGRRRGQVTAMARPAAPSSSRPPAPERAQGAKRRKHNDGSAGAVGDAIIELTSDEEETPSAATQPPQRRSGEDELPSPATRRPRKRLLHPLVPATNPVKVSAPTKLAAEREIIIISDDDEPTSSSNTRKSSGQASARSTKPTRAQEVIVIDDDDEPMSIVPAQGSSSTARHLTCSSFTVTRNRRDKGKGKMRAADEDEDDSGADSDKTLC
ncbi:hypothetical protein LXA43DRAFT_1089559 [Ganoderma leucocontextum]|nr:hypothetical protein LXA43DRAFT_1089559 [Ganoderma leucocontextum]